MGSQSFTGPGWKTFDVPAKVERIEVDLKGGGSAGGGGRQAGHVHGVLLVKDTWTLQIFVAGGGTASSGSTGGDGGVGGGADGANGRGGRAGGDGGGGATYIRINTKDGTIKAVAGGAGGNSGDGGVGGRGGADIGEHGRAGNGGPGDVGNSTGGTQTQPGNGGTSSFGGQYNGHDAATGKLGHAGAGGIANTGNECAGGGGGGGGFFGGGGGQASAPGRAPGGGGSGGSNYDGGLTQVTINSQGGGGTGNGEVTLEWVNPSPANQPPSSPSKSEVELNGEPVTDDMHTKITGAPHITAVLKDPDKDRVRMVVHYSTNKNFNPQSTVTSDLVDNGKKASVQLANLAQQTHYFVRLITVDQHGMRSTDSASPPGWTAFDFWTNETSLPDHLTINGAGAGVAIPSIESTTLAWQFNDPDKADLQSGFSLRYRTVATSTDPPGPWHTVTKDKADNMAPGQGPPSHSRNQWVFDPGTFSGNQGYSWQVRTKDLQGLWSDWSLMSNFFTTSTTSAPVLKSPVKSIAVDVDTDVTFTWQFRDPDGDPQQKADIRWRLVGQGEDEWLTTLGDATVPGSTKKWTFPDGTFSPGLHYEWQVRTYDGQGHQSDWSNSGRFWSIATPGAEGGPVPLPDVFSAQDVLGCGTYRVFVYQQGGEVVIGEITPIATLSFTRLRDDISAANVVSNGLGDPDCCEFLARLRCWMHEIVIYRDGVRVWEGPITLLTFETDKVTIDAQDVMVYARRRIMRQGYNDTFRIVARDSQGKPTETAGLMSVVLRAEIILANAFAPFDPNILPYLTVITGPGDANESQVRPDWATEAWDEIDKLAADNGLDYTTVGRRIILWGTHTPIGRLPQMTDGDFSSPPIVSEYGMQLATFYAVTNGNGVAGTAHVNNPHRPPGTEGFYPYGPIELLVSSFSESDSATPDTLTPDARQKLVKALQEQARVGISDRWPTPLLVRVPDNSTLSPDCGFGFQQLVPGVWFPLAAAGTCRTVTQWQKLDSVAVTYDENGEKVAVVMSPAPNGGQDFDATGGPITGDGSDNAAAAAFFEGSAEEDA